MPYGPDDELRVPQVLFILIGNAIKFTDTEVHRGRRGERPRHPDRKSTTTFLRSSARSTIRTRAPTGVRGCVSPFPERSSRSTVGAPGLSRRWSGFDVGAFSLADEQKDLRPRLRAVLREAAPRSKPWMVPAADFPSYRVCHTTEVLILQISRQLATHWRRVPIF
jgi:hypothetical protein